LLWTLVAFASSLPILAIALGTAAWNGVNFAVGLYLFLSAAGSLCVLAGVFAAFFQGSIFPRIACISASVIAGLSAFFGLWFIFGRGYGVPLDEPFFFAGSARVPLLVIYSFAFFCSAVEVLLYLPETKRRESSLD